MAQFWETILMRLNQISKYVQSVEIDVFKVSDVLESVREFLSELRVQFEIHEEKVFSISENKTYERDEKRRMKRKLEADENRDGEM